VAVAVPIVVLMLEVSRKNVSFTTFIFVGMLAAAATARGDGFA
jgi:hypothetical protein